ncbi:MAG: hypothetical protein ACE14M_13850 [Terriglobales bacterium]
MDFTSSLAAFAVTDIWLGWWVILAVLLIAIIMKRRGRKEKETKAKGAGASGRYGA